MNELWWRRRYGGARNTVPMMGLPALLEEYRFVSKSEPEAGTASTTVTVMNFQLLQALQYMRRGWSGPKVKVEDLRKADTKLDEMLATEHKSIRKLRSRTLVFCSNEKNVYMFNDVFQARTMKEHGLNLIIKEYAPEKIAWLADYWQTLREENRWEPALPKGETCARTERRLLSLVFTGGNLGYEVLPTMLHSSSLDQRLVAMLVKDDKALIAFTQKYNCRIGTKTYEEAYEKKFTQSLQGIVNLLDEHGKNNVLVSYRQERESFIAAIRDGATMVPYTDMKGFNIVLEPGATLEMMLKTGKGYRVVDADKMGRNITLAHNFAHIVYDPSWNVDHEERTRLFEERGLLGDDSRRRTGAGLVYYLGRQVALLLSGPRGEYAPWFGVERAHLEGFYSSFRAVLKTEEAQEFKFLQSLERELPDTLPPWRPKGTAEK
jgi:hypothetical protein